MPCRGLVSCNGKSADFLARSGACPRLVSCNGRLFGPGPYPGFALRQAWTRLTCCGPQKYCWFSGFASQRLWLARLLARRHAGFEQYLCWKRVRGSAQNSSWQHGHRRRLVLLTGPGPPGPHHAQRSTLIRSTVAPDTRPPMPASPAGAPPRMPVCDARALLPAPPRCLIPYS